TDVKNIDIAFLPIGLPYTMAPGMAIEAAKMLKIKILYPYHFNTSNPEEILKAMAAYPIEVRLRSMK
ncbi:MAG: MBL fold metallo-hydrolase, partial [Bacteroidales bacterium]|nr:MBL fold metallo-hydrolase [Bacteroidales bacterium]